MEALIGLKNTEQFAKKAYQLMDRDHSGSIERHEWLAAFPYVSSSDSPNMDLEAGEKQFVKMDKDHDGKIDKAEFFHWFSENLGSVSVDDLPSRLFHQSQFLDRKALLKEAFHLHDQATPNRIKTSDAKTLVQSTLPGLSANAVKDDVLTKMDPKKTGYVLPLPFMHAMYWQTKSMSVAELREALKPAIEAGRKHALHSVFEAFDHGRKGSLDASDWSSFAQLDAKELTRGKVKNIDERKQHEIVTKIDSKFKERKIDHLSEDEFLPVLDEITANLKATQLNKVVEGYRAAASGVKASEKKEEEEEE